MNFRFRSKIYRVEECQIEDIPSCIELVKPYWSDIEIDKRAEELKECQGIKILDEDRIVAFFYWKQLSMSIIEGVAAWFSRKPFCMMMIQWGKLNYPCYEYIYFSPHKKPCNTFQMDT